MGVFWWIAHDLLVNYNNGKQHQSLQQVSNNINKSFKNNFVQAYSWGLDIAGCYERAKHLFMWQHWCYEYWAQ